LAEEVKTGIPTACFLLLQSGAEWGGSGTKRGGYLLVFPEGEKKKKGGGRGCMGKTENACLTWFPISDEGRKKK